MYKQTAALLLALLLTVTAIPCLAAEAEEAEESIGITVRRIQTPVMGGTGTEVKWDADALEGKTISILGDSISTYRNYSNRQGARWSNISIGKGKAWYSDLKPKIALEDTWWMQLAEDLGLRILVNNSWSGSTFFMTRSKTTGAFADRCVQLHDNTGINDGAEPDIILIYLGSNDFTYFRSQLGSGAVDYAALITQDDRGETHYAAPNNTLEAAAITLDKIQRRYPLAEIYLMELPRRGDAKGDNLERLLQLDADLAAVAEHFGAVVIPTLDGPITAETAEHYYLDGRLHPNALGMDVLTEAAKSTILANTAWKTPEFHRVRFELDGVEADYGTDRLVREAAPFRGKLKSADPDAAFTVEITMDGRDITSQAYKNGVVNIAAVTADVTIRAKKA